MNQEKIGKLIKDIRIKNNLTQKMLADSLDVTYQAVSKWENGKNIPDIATLKLISKMYNVDINDLLEGNYSKHNKNGLRIIIFVLIILVISIISWVLLKKQNDFEFKTIGTTCNNFEITGSAAYNRDQTSLYISNINYCGKDDYEEYKSITCNLYENYQDTDKLVSACMQKKNMSLEKFLKTLTINVDNYSSSCKYFKKSSLYLEINAKDKNDKIITYNIPLTLKDNC